jgi:hypothetical protein
MEIAARTLVKLGELPGSKGVESYDYDIRQAFEFISEERNEVSDCLEPKHSSYHANKNTYFLVKAPGSCNYFKGACGSQPYLLLSASVSIL